MEGLGEPGQCQSLPLITPFFSGMPSTIGANGSTNTPKPASRQNSTHEDQKNQQDLEHSSSGIKSTYNFEAIDDKGISHSRRAVHMGGRTRSMVTRKFIEDLGYRTFPLTPTHHLQSRDTAYGLPQVDEFVSLKVHGTWPGASLLDLNFGVSSEEHRPDGADIYVGEETQKRIGKIQTLCVAPLEDLCRLRPDQERPVNPAAPSSTRKQEKVELKHRLPSVISSSHEQDDGAEVLCPGSEYEILANDIISGAIEESIPDSTDSHSGTGNAPVFTSRGPPRSSIPTSIESEEASRCSTEGRVDLSVKMIPEEAINPNLLSRDYTPKARRIHTMAPDVS